MAMAAGEKAGGAKSAGAHEAEGIAAPAPKKRRKLVLMLLPLLLVVLAAGGWYSGLIPRLLGRGAGGKMAAAPPEKPVFVALPVLIANLATSDGRTAYVKMQVKLEVGGDSAAAAVRAALPRIMDLFQTYLRDMHPSELRGSAGTYRLREELLARADDAVAPARIRNVLFTQMLVQ